LNVNHLILRHNPLLLQFSSKYILLDWIVHDSSSCCQDGTITVRNEKYTFFKEVPCFAGNTRKPRECMQSLWTSAGCHSSGEKSPDKRSHKDDKNFIEIQLNSHKYFESVKLIKKLALFGGSNAFDSCFGQYNSECRF
jgi:hypothetical protein